MITAICTAIAGILGFISVLLNLWMAGQEKRDEKTREEEIQQGRRDIVDGNVDAVQQRIDRLLTKSSSDPAGSKDGET